MIVADITRAYSGSEASLLRKIGEYAKANGNIGVAVVCHETQAQFVNSEFPAYSRTTPPAGDPSSIADAIWRNYIEPNFASAVAVSVISFHPRVLGLSQRIPIAAQDRIHFVHWMKFQDGGSTEFRPPAVVGSSFPLSPKQIIETVAAAMEKYPSGVRLTDLRQALSRENAAFDKVITPQSGVPGFISGVVASAKAAGVIEVDASRDRYNPTLFLKRPPLQTVPAAQSTTVPATTKTELKTPTRAQRFADLLKQADLGPFTTVRARLYESVERLASEGKWTANGIIRMAVSQTKAQVTVDPRFPWWAVEKFLFRLLGLHKVLLGASDEQLDPNALESLGLSVVKLKPNWTEILDAEIVFFLIQTEQNVAAFDIPNLAGVLYSDRSPEAQNRIEKLLKLLEGDGKIAVAERGVFFAK